MLKPCFIKSRLANLIAPSTLFKKSITCSLCSVNILDKHCIDRHSFLLDNQVSKHPLQSTCGRIVGLCLARSYGHQAHAKRRRNALKRLKNKPHYDHLGVQPTATLKEIKSAYYDLSKKYHPDKNASQEAKKKYSQISAAYEALKDPENRLEEEHAEEMVKEMPRRKGRHSAKKPSRPAPEYAERFDPRWPIEEEFEYSQKHNRFFRKYKSHPMHMTNRRIKVHQTPEKDESFMHFSSFSLKNGPKKQASEETKQFDSTNYIFVGFLLLLAFIYVTETE